MATITNVVDFAPHAPPQEPMDDEDTDVASAP